MADIAEAFEQHLKSLTDAEWKALEGRVRTPPPNPADGGKPTGTSERDEGLAEARRRGYITDDK